MRNDRGSVLFLVIIFIVVFSLVGTAVIYLNSTEEITSRQEIDRARALYLAEAGIERALLWFNTTGQLPEGVLVNGTPNGVNPLKPFGEEVLFENSLPSSPGSYSVTIDPDNANNGRADKIYKITSIGRTPMFQKTIEINVSLRNRLQYAYFSEFEYPDSNSQPTGRYDHTYFVTCDSITGQAFSNDQIAVLGKPNFSRVNGIYQVWTNKNYYYYSTPGTTPNSLDLQLTNTSAPRVEMFRDIDLTKLARAAQNEGFYFSGDRTITLLSNANSGHFMVSGVASPYTITGSTAVVFVSGNITLTNDGQAFKKRLTIVSSGTAAGGGDIEIIKGAFPVSSSGMIGLVAKKDIIFSNQIPTIPANVSVNAIMMAFGSIRVRDYNSRFKSFTDPFNPWPEKGVLTITGALVQRYRGLTGTMPPSASATEPPTGYKKNYIFDQRIIDNPPPYFPAIEKWRRVARSEGFAERVP